MNFIYDYQNKIIHSGCIMGVACAWMLLIANIKQPISKSPRRYHAHKSDVKLVWIMHLHNGRGHPKITKLVVPVRKVEPERVKLFFITPWLR